MGVFFSKGDLKVGKFYSVSNCGQLEEWEYKYLFLKIS